MCVIPDILLLSMLRVRAVYFLSGVTYLSLQLRRPRGTLHPHMSRMLKHISCHHCGVTLVCHACRASPIRPIRHVYDADVVKSQ
eukprot:1317957-Amorphochlora_amoeboformis.AAC.1